MTFHPTTTIDDEHETPLQGGRTTGGVVRVANTVRRPPTWNSDFVRRLLGHLEAGGFEGAPRALGTDKQGRDVLAYIVGKVPIDLAFHDDQALSRAAILIRRYHDLTQHLVTSPAARSVGIEVVCHNDLSPCNFVFHAGLPTAIIDFDAASPGTRAHDLSYAAWLWLDLGSPGIGPAEQQRRLAFFLAAYGTDGPDAIAIVDGMLTRQSIVAARGRQTEDAAMVAWAEDCRAWTLHHAQRLRGLRQDP